MPLHTPLAPTQEITDFISTYISYGLPICELLCKQNHAVYVLYLASLAQYNVKSTCFLKSQLSYEFTRSEKILRNLDGYW